MYKEPQIAFEANRYSFTDAPQGPNVSTLGRI
jgi:hypothetical protein